jgi:hypothetical protein
MLPENLGVKTPILKRRYRLEAGIPNASQWKLLKWTIRLSG